MYETSHGERILLGAERRLFEESLGMMVDLLSDGDYEFGVRVFDELQPGQKLFALYRVARALLRPDEPPPEPTAFGDAAVASVYRHVWDRIVQEIDDLEDDPQSTSWRSCALAAARETQSMDKLPSKTSRDKQAWELVLDCLADRILRDRDFEMDVHLDVDPETSRNVKAVMGVSPDYYSAAADDPPDHQLNLYRDALQGLTPRGRGDRPVS